jgi:hypothetical protein
MELRDLPALSVSQEEMDAWAHTCGRANYALLQTLQTLDALARADEDTRVVAERLRSAAVAIDTLLQFLVRAGAARPAHAPSAPAQPASVPSAAETVTEQKATGLEQTPAPPLVPRLDTPAARRLLALLREAQVVAGDVDEERYGQAGNAGWSEAIEKLAFPLSVEIHGPPKPLEPRPF